MLSKWLGLRREAALYSLIEHQRMTRHMVDFDAEPHLRRLERAARRRLKRWDIVLDIFTLNGRI